MSRGSTADMRSGTPTQRRRDQSNHSGRLCYKSLSGEGPNEPRGTVSIPSSGHLRPFDVIRLEENICWQYSRRKQFVRINVSSFNLRDFGLKTRSVMRVCEREREEREVKDLRDPDVLRRRVYSSVRPDCTLVRHQTSSRLSQSVVQCHRT